MKLLYFHPESDFGYLAPEFEISGQEPCSPYIGGVFFTASLVGVMILFSVAPKT